MKYLAAAVLIAGVAALGAEGTAERWIKGLLRLDPAGRGEAERPRLVVLRQDHERLEVNRSVVKTSLQIGNRSFAHGLGAHSVGRYRVAALAPIARFSAWIGVDGNPRTAGGQGSVVFTVSAGGRTLYRSPVMRGGEEPVRIDLETGGGRGMVLAFRRDESPYRTIEVGLKGLRPDALYRVSFKTAGRALNVPGRELSSRLEITIPERRASELIVYEEERR